jgi:hypothetical protein
VFAVLTGSVSFGGLQAYGLGHAADPDTGGTIYPSMVGYGPPWSWRLMNNTPSTEWKLRDAPWTHAQRTSRSRNAAHHMVPHHRRDTHLEAGNRSTFSIQTRHRLIYCGLDRATSVPLFKDWAATLWKRGVKAKLIERVPDTRGVTTWRVSAEGDLWLALIEREIANGRLQV